MRIQWLPDQWSKNFALKYLKAGTRFSGRFFTCVLVVMGLLLLTLAVYDYRAEEVISNLKDRYTQMEQFRNEIIHLDEALSMSARMAAATGDIKWEKRYQYYEPKLTGAIKQAVALSPEIYRQETDRSSIGKIKLLEMEHKAFDLIRAGHDKEAMQILFGDQYEIQKKNYIQAIQRLNLFLKLQMEMALSMEKSKEYFARMAFATALILLLLAWLIIMRIARHAQESLIESNRQLSERTEQLTELTHTLDDKVHERTRSLAVALTQLQKAHQDLKDVQTQLLQSEKFSAIGQLAAGIAHEINNPIGFINSNLQTLGQYVAHYTQLLGILNKLEKALKDKDKERAAQVVHSWEKLRAETNFAFIDDDIVNLIKESRDGAEKIRKIILDLRTFASPDKGVMDSVNFEALVESVLNIVWNELKYKAEIKKDYGDVPFIACNPQAIGQVLVNLLINAAQAIRDHGTITIRTYVKGDYVFMDIIDTGCGIPPENITKIFDPFFTTKPPGQGVGLGLSLSYDIIRKHGGKLTFTSQVGKGTTFTVMLPVAYAAKEMA
jgi:signal transduction histidine kinase